MNYDRFSGSNEPDPVDDAEEVLDAFGMRWELALDEHGNTRTSLEDRSDMWKNVEPGVVLYISWDQLVEHHGPLVIAPSASKETP